MPDRLSPVLIERPIGSNSIDPRFFNVSRSRSIEPSFVLVSTRERERKRETANTLIGRRLNFHDGHPRYFARGFVFLPLRTRNLARILGTWHAFNIMGKRVLRGISLEAGSETVKRVDLQVLTFLAAIPIAPPQNDRHFFLRRSLPLVEEKRCFPRLLLLSL